MTKNDPILFLHHVKTRLKLVINLGGPRSVPKSTVAWYKSDGSRPSPDEIQLSRFSLLCLLPFPAVHAEIHLKLSNSSARDCVQPEVAQHPPNLLTRKPGKGRSDQGWKQSQQQENHLIACIFPALIFALGRYSCKYFSLFLPVLPYTYLVVAGTSAFNLRSYTYLQAQAHFPNKADLELQQPTHVPCPVTVNPSLSALTLLCAKANTHQ